MKCRWFIEIKLVIIYRVYRDLLTNHGHLVERLVCGKMNKQQFLDAEINISKKKEQLAEKLNQLVASIWKREEKQWANGFFKNKSMSVVKTFTNNSSLHLSLFIFQ